MFKHLLVPLDGSRLAEMALKSALAIAGRFDSEITLLRVVVAPYLALDARGTAYTELLVGLQEQAFAEARAYLADHQGSLRAQGYKVHCHLTRHEPVPEAILEVAAGLGIDIVVMSTHGRGGLSRWVYGSVADRVLQRASIPVLLVRVHEGEFDWKRVEEKEKTGDQP